VTVYLVGAGPGDPDLVTMRGIRLLQRADAVVYDELAPPELLAETRPEALQISRAGLRQPEVDELLVTLGRSFETVVRLKGGDPFLFGRGREEVDALGAAGIDCEVVPGVSALTAVPAAAGIPLTHRGLAAQVTVITARSAAEDELDFDLLAQAPGTLVVFMGVARLQELADGLIAAGKSPETPAAVISNGTTERQRTAVGRLDEIGELAYDLPSPALTVIGPTAAFAQASQRSANQRTADQTAGLALV
jgi:uroporphyrin-III C-methyltransferase